MRRFREPEQYMTQEIKDVSHVSIEFFNSRDDFIEAIFEDEAEDEDEMEL